MNKERLLALADVIEAQPHTTVDDKRGFSMAAYAHHCGTPSCIAGFAVSEFLDAHKILSGGGIF